MNEGNPEVSQTILDEKRRLRRDMHFLLGAVSHEEISVSSGKICQILSLCKQLSGARKTVSTFAAHGKEVDLSSLHTLVPSLRLVYPLCHPQRRLTFHAVQSPQELTEGSHGVMEPDPEKHHRVPVEEIDLFLCPGLAFAHNGARLGHGGGYYDRALAGRSNTSEIWGVCLNAQLVQSIPCAPHDQHVACITTESGIITTTTL